MSQDKIIWPWVPSVGRISTSREFTIPSGFRKTLWTEVAVGDKVWVVGLAEGVPHAYGPHFVHDLAERTLRNGSGRTFYERSDGLLTQVEDGKDGKDSVNAAEAAAARVEWAARMARAAMAAALLPE